MNPAVFIPVYVVLCGVAVGVIMGYSEYGQMPRGLRWIARLRAGLADRALKTFYPEVWQKQNGEAK